MTNLAIRKDVDENIRLNSEAKEEKSPSVTYRNKVFQELDQLDLFPKDLILLIVQYDSPSLRNLLLTLFENGRMVLVRVSEKQNWLPWCLNCVGVWNEVYYHPGIASWDDMETWQDVPDSSCHSILNFYYAGVKVPKMGETIYTSSFPKEGNRKVLLQNLSGNFTLSASADFHMEKNPWRRFHKENDPTFDTEKIFLKMKVCIQWQDWFRAST